MLLLSQGGMEPLAEDVLDQNLRSSSHRVLGMPPSIVDAQLASSPSLRAALSAEMGLRTLEEVGHHHCLIVSAACSGLREAFVQSAPLGGALPTVGLEESPE